MKITIRIISGYGLLIGVLIALVIYQVITINRMQSVNQTLSEANFQNALTCLQAMRDRDLVDEYTQKLFALGDPGYLNQLKEFQRDFEVRLSELQNGLTSERERLEVNRLIQLWYSFTEDLQEFQQPLPQGGLAMPQNLQDGLDQLRAQIESVYRSTVDSMSSGVEISKKTGRTAVLVLWLSAFAVFAISIPVSFLILRSIYKPLAHLTEGTRAIAEGKFLYRLDTSRNDEFSQLAKDFNTMTRRLNELDELKRDFVSHVSHELKSPLASMQETIQLMLEQIPGPLTEKQKSLLELNLQSVLRLTSMINNLLDLSKAEAGAMEYELKSQDLIPLVRNAIAELEVQARERQIQIKLSLPGESLLVKCDTDRIMQVILNLVGNAIKFSPRKGTVEVQLEATQKAPETMPEQWSRLIVGQNKGKHYGLVIVSDSGPGVPDSDKERIFEKFHQGKQGKKAAGQGVGLGLAICRTIVQAHGGAIWAEDNIGGGSRFLLLLRPGETDKTNSPVSFLAVSDE